MGIFLQIKQDLQQKYCQDAKKNQILAGFFLFSWDFTGGQ